MKCLRLLILLLSLLIFSLQSPLEPRLNDQAQFTDSFYKWLEHCRNSKPEQVLEVETFRKVENCEQMIIENENDSDNQISLDNRNNSFINLFDDVLNLISEYLDPKSVLQLRSTSKDLLLHFHVTNRVKFKWSLRPSIKIGFECLEENGVLAFYLNNLNTLGSLLVTRAYNRDGDFIRDGEFIEFIYYAIYYYHDHDLNLFWKLIEVLLKSRILNYTGFVDNFKFEVEEMVRYACDLNLLCLMKMTLNENILNLITIKNGCITCISNDFYILFKLLLLEFRKYNLSASSLLLKAIEAERIDYVHLIFDLFPVTPKENSLALFEAIRRKNLEITRLLLTRNLDFEIYSETGLNFMELAAKHNFVAAIELLSNLNNNYFLCTSVLKVAVYYKSHDSLILLLMLITDHGSLSIDQIYSKDAISYLLSDCISQANYFALDKILENLDSDSIEDFEVLFEDYEETAIYRCNLIHFAIIIDDYDAFGILLTHFGVESLKISSARGLNSFSLAAKYGNTCLVHRIAELCPELSNYHTNNRT